MTESLCTFRWSYPIYYMFDQTFAYCCRTPPQPIEQNQIDKHGTNIFSKMDYFQERRAEMLAGVKHKDCESCWKLESHHIPSPRESSNFMSRLVKQNHGLPNETFPDLLASEVRRNQIQQISLPSILEIVLSNGCNAKCVYCNEYYSSAWRAENKAQGLPERFKSKARNKEHDELFWKWVQETAAPKLNRIGFIGGEPLILPELYECFDKLDEIFDLSRNHPPEICITSNLSIPPVHFDKFLDYIQKLKQKFHFVLQVSLEAPKTQTEYIRFGTNGSLIENNLKKIVVAHPDIEILFLPTLNILAVPTLKNFLQHIHQFSLEYQKPIRLFSNTVTDPHFLNPAILPSTFAFFITEAIDFLNSISDECFDSKQKESYDKYIHYLTNLRTTIEKNLTMPANLQEQFQQYFYRLDSIRKTSFIHTFPDLAEFI